MSNRVNIREVESGASKMQASLKRIFAKLLKQLRDVDEAMKGGRINEALGQVRGLEEYLEWAVEEMGKPLP